MTTNGLRARRIGQTRQKMVVAARAFVDAGRPFTIEEVTAEAGVSLRTFWRYFEGGRTELMLEALGIEEGLTFLPSNHVAKFLYGDAELLGAAFVRISGGDPMNFMVAAQALKSV